MRGAPDVCDQRGALDSNLATGEGSVRRSDNWVDLSRTSPNLRLCLISSNNRFRCTNSYKERANADQPLRAAIHYRPKCLFGLTRKTDLNMTGEGVRIQSNLPT